jgi:HK97 family phage portal protein
MWPFSQKAATPETRDWVDLSHFTDFGDINGSGNTRAGVTINEATALALPVVYSCINLNSQVIASLPVDCFAKRGEDRVIYPAPFWLERPNSEQDWGEFIAQALVSRYLDGNIFILKAVVGARLSGMYVLNPAAITVRRELIDGRYVIVYAVDGPAGRAALSSTEILHIKGMTPPGQLRGLSPIACARETLGLAAAAEAFSALFYGNGATMSGVIEHPASTLTEEQANRLKDSFTRKHGGVSKSHAIGVLSGGAHWTQLSVSPDDALALETLKLTGIQIAHLFGAPPYMVTADSEGSKGYVTSLLASRMDWYTTGLQPEIVRLERAFSALLPRPAFIRFNMRAFLRGNAAETAAQMTAEISNGVRSPEEWRAVLDYEPSGMPRRYYMQGGTFVLDDEGNPVPPKGPAPEPPKKLPEGEAEPFGLPAPDDESEDGEQ